MPSTMTLDRFMRKVHKTDSCWLWAGGLANGGYGLCCVNYRNYNAHKASYLLHFGMDSVPDGHDVHHLCGVPLCVNPDHLEVMEHVAHMQHSQEEKKSKTHCPHGHAYEGANLYVAPNGTRKCKTCRKARFQAGREAGKW